MKLLIAIPAYNEEKVIGLVLEKVPHKIPGVKKIDRIVVDDGSEDNTARIAKKKNTKVIKHLLNRGLGGAIKTIMEYASINNYDILVTLDADGQHDPNDIKKLIIPLKRNTCDVVIGSRWLGKERSPWSRYVVNQVANILTAILVGIYSSDSQSGMRAFNRHAINAMNIQTDGMEVSSEVFKEVKKNNLKVKEVAIRPVYTTYSKLKGQKMSDAPDVLFRLILRLIR